MSPFQCPEAVQANSNAQEVQTQTTMKAAVIVMSDPRSGSEESLGRLFNALAAAYAFKQRGDDVTVLFQGAGTRWPGEVVKEDHPAHQLYREIEDRVAGISCGCADVFGGAAEAQQAASN